MQTSVIIGIILMAVVVGALAYQLRTFTVSATEPIFTIAGEDPRCKIDEERTKSSVLRSIAVNLNPNTPNLPAALSEYEIYKECGFGTNRHVEAQIALLRNREG